MLNNKTHCSKTNYTFNCTIVPGYMHVNNKKNCPKKLTLFGLELYSVCACANVLKVGVSLI